jgi:leucyl/phenylalanyl-tRNA---protein transferase
MSRIKDVSEATRLPSVTGSAEYQEQDVFLTNLVAATLRSVENRLSGSGGVRRPVEPPPSRWELPWPLDAPDDLVCGGGDLEPGTILSAYRIGLFPMPLTRRRLGWWSPNPRGVLPLDGMTISRSLRKSCGRFEVTVDSSFRSVMERCADPSRPHGWIDGPFLAAYTSLHALGWAHSVEVWQESRLVGGLYGLAINGLFAGESMFHEVTDASKVALVALVQRLREAGYTLLDVQWRTDHLGSLGVVDISRAEYLRRLDEALHIDATWLR